MRLKGFGAQHNLIIDANHLSDIGPLAALSSLKVLSVTNNQIGYENWPETAEGLAVLKELGSTVHFAPQEPLSVYADVPRAKSPSEDPDPAVMGSSSSDEPRED
ncbi:MAG: hypothetical protein AAFU79_32520 [Myxococcota bacterium]